jgi:hypothetical protein
MAATGEANELERKTTGKGNSWKSTVRVRIHRERLQLLDPTFSFLSLDLD